MSKETALAVSQTIIFYTITALYSSQGGYFLFISSMTTLKVIKTIT
jgi:hypothetical protein